MGKDAAYWIKNLDLTKHPEGGCFREIYRAGLTLAGQHLPSSFGGDRNCSTCIYFLLEGADFSAFHRIASDEIWHFYFGDPLLLYEIETVTGHLVTHILGEDPERGEFFQAVIRAGNWFGSRVTDPNGYSLVGCTVSPGFDFEDFDLARRDSLSKEYPQYEDLIRSLTR